MRYDGCKWGPVPHSEVVNEVRVGLVEFQYAQGLGGANHDYLTKVSRLLSVARIKGIAELAKGYLLVADDAFDQCPDLLNVRNGVVDLRDGTLRPHDREPDAHQGGDDRLRPGRRPRRLGQGADRASRRRSQDWLQMRLGQGLTGYPAPDDVMVVLQGSGDNGKTTIVEGLRGALAPDHAVTLPDRVLLARTGDHPTELMTLRGARLAVMEEFPELGHLNVKRLKDLHGTGEMSARHCGKDTVYWTPSHTIFVTTNYLPRVDESDHGTWRRLALVRFPYRYRRPHEEIERDGDLRGDPTLRQRVRDGHDGQHEALLAWLVRGAMRWYQDGRVMPGHPEAVETAIADWRGSVDLLLRYIGDRLVFDGERHVMSRELYEDFTDWLREHGHLVWTDQNFSARLSQHSGSRSRGEEKGPVVEEGALATSTQWPREPHQAISASDAIPCLVGGQIPHQRRSGGR